MEGEKPFRFLDLPAELRINIYEHVFANITEFPHHKVCCVVTSRQLLLVSKQIYKEATKTFYGATTFYLRNIESLPLFGRLSTEHQEAIACVRVWSADCLEENPDESLQDFIAKAGLKLRPGVVYLVEDDDMGHPSWRNQFGEEGGNRKYP